MQTFNIGRYFSPWAGMFLAGLVLALLGPAPAHASLILTVGSATVSAGGSGSFDVTLQNTGSAVTVDAFNFVFSTSNTFVTLLSTTISTTQPYIFGANGLGSPISIPSGLEPNAQTMNAGDVWTGAGNGASVGTTTVGLGHVLFSVASNATPGNASLVVNTSTNDTSLSDINGGLITIDMENNGQITITASSGVPEPSTLIPLALLLLAGVLLRRRSALGC